MFKMNDEILDLIDCVLYWGRGLCVLLDSGKMLGMLIWSDVNMKDNFWIVC